MWLKVETRVLDGFPEFHVDGYFPGIHADSGSVSYTHLDVYKRQLLKDVADEAGQCWYRRTSEHFGQAFLHEGNRFVPFFVGD